MPTTTDTPAPTTTPTPTTTPIPGPLDYSSSAALMGDFTFRGRVKVACLKFANAIMIEAPTAAAHNARLRWATLCFQQPDIVAGQVTPPAVMDPGVQAAGGGIDDAALQGAVEATVNAFF